MKLGQILAVTLLGFILTTPAFADDSKNDKKESGQSQSKDKPKPYGCFKDLRWGMTLDETQKSLDIPLKKFTLKSKESFIANGEIKIGDKNYIISLSFGPSNLSCVTIWPKEIDPRSGKLIVSSATVRRIYDTENANIVLAAYDSFKQALTEKFGKPIKESKEDRGNDVSLINNIIDHKAALSSTWETDESIITLKAETFAMEVKAGDPTLPTYWEPFLVYLQKTGTEDIKKNEKKIEL